VLLPSLVEALLNYLALRPLLQLLIEFLHQLMDVSRL
jgi:hypothetical protein